MIKSVCGLWGSPLFSVLFQMKVFLKIVFFTITGKNGIPKKVSESGERV